jgi:serine/threonine protein kinase
MGIVDIIKDLDNFPCIIMEKCNQSLTDLINNFQDNPIPEKQILRILAMICIPLYHIHQKNMVHRDLNPNNIL